VIEIVGGSDLFDAAVVHHHHPVGQRHRLDLVVGHVDGGGADFLVHFLDFDPHLDPELGVEIGQRLVEQKNLGIAHDGAAHRDPLALAARQLLRLAVDQFDDVEHARGLLDPGLDLGFRIVFQAQPERHVFGHRHVRVKRVILEHHGNVAVLRRHVVDDVAADHDVAVGDILQPGNHSQRGRFSAARRSHQHDEFMVGDVQIDAAHRLDVVIPFDNLAQGDISHRHQPFVAPAVSPAI